MGEWGSSTSSTRGPASPSATRSRGTGSNGVTINTIGTGTLAGVGAPGSVGTTFNRWRPNPAVTTGLVGFEGVGGGANNLNVRDTFDPRMLNRTLISPASVDTASSRAGSTWHARATRNCTARPSSTAANHPDRLPPAVARLHAGQPADPGQPARLQPNLQARATTIRTGAAQVRAFIGFGNDESEQTSTTTRSWPA